MFEFKIDGSRCTVNAATSVKKDGSFRYTTSSDIGGDGIGVRGFEAHKKKVDNWLSALNQHSDTRWECKHFLALYSPKRYFCYLTNGEISLNYIYKSTDAPGSGQGWIFCPQLSTKQIKFQMINIKSAAFIIANKLPIDYEKMSYGDETMLIELMDAGLPADVITSTMSIIK
jgi:hypothetical protein